MGNWFGRKKVVHPLPQEYSPSCLRVKVRMTKTQLRELMDLSKGDSELGRLILQECMEGRLSARVWPQERFNPRRR
ncbi:hypothetical protein FH972_003740 [Carpinus fangiana]|uniref:Uncharacterized protein n=1 Tax=Carpinus fangiana TaxID=176857 RepID=A0A5N6QMG2_9ROSI|nr:hypothetical protein FH972_003740 [Carpinus fangiana]